jgi:hypothetical protein
MSIAPHSEQFAVVVPPTLDYARRYANAIDTHDLEILVITTRMSGNSEVFAREFRTLVVDELTAQPDGLVDTLSTQYSLRGLLAAGEFAVVPTEYIATRLGLQRGMIGDPAVLRDKSLMRATFRCHGVVQPRVYGTAGNADELVHLVDSIIKYPVISKPVDMAGSWFVKLNRDREELITNCLPIFEYRQSRQTGIKLAARCLLEEYVIGPECSAEVVVFESSLVHCFVTRKITSSPPVFDEIGHVSGLALAPAIHAQLKETVRRIVVAANVRSAILHVEFRIVADGICVMEAACRVPGDNITQLVEIQHGLSLEEVLVGMRLGVPPRTTAPPHGDVTGIRFFFPGFALPRIDGESVIESVALNEGKELDRTISATHLQNRRGYEIFRARAEPARAALGLLD